MEIHTSNFTSANCFATRDVERSTYLSSQLLPDRLVFACTCIAPSVPDTRCIKWAQEIREQRLEVAGAFDLALQALEQLAAWVTRLDQSR